MHSSEPNISSTQSSHDTRDTSLVKEGGHDEGPQQQQSEISQVDPSDQGDNGLDREHSKHVHLDLKDIEKLEQQKKAKGFADLVLYDERGKPYIDVNRLIYKPRKRHKKQLKERLSWFFSDVVFISANFLSLICSSYLISIGLSMATWDTNIKPITAYAHNYNHENAAILRINHLVGKDNRASTYALGYSLMIFAAINGINVFSGIFACIYGKKWFLIQHIVLDVVTIIIQLAVGFLATFGGTCVAKELELFKIGFQDLIHLQASTNITNQIIVDDQYYASLQLDSVQINMECCGASNWTDYLNPDVVKFSYTKTRKSSSQVAKVLPYSCCKEQWVRNLQCAEGVHEWAAPIQSKLTRKMFRERIHQEGCGPKVWHVCIRLLIMAGPMLLFNALFNTILVSIESVTVILQIRSYSTIARELIALEESTKKSDEKEHRRLSKGKDALLETDESQHDLENPMKSALEHFKDILPPPTEDDIAHIKTRTAFQQFEKKLNRTAVGKMMQKIRATVSDFRTTLPQGPRDHKALRHSLLKKRKHHHHHYKELVEHAEVKVSAPPSAHSSSATVKSQALHDEKLALKAVSAYTRFNIIRTKKPVVKKVEKKSIPIVPVTPTPVVKKRRIISNVPGHIIRPTKNKKSVGKRISSPDPSPVVSTSLRTKTKIIPTVASHVILNKTKRQKDTRPKKKVKGGKKNLQEKEATSDLEIQEEEEEEDVVLVNEGIQTSTPHVPPPTPQSPTPEPPQPAVFVSIEPPEENEPPKTLSKRRSSPMLMKPKRLMLKKRGFEDGAMYDKRTGLIRGSMNVSKTSIIKDTLEEKEKNKHVSIDSTTSPPEVKRRSTAGVRKPAKKVTLNKYTSRTQGAIDDLLKHTEDNKRKKKKSPSKKKLGRSKSKAKKKAEPKPIIRKAWV